jgi:hypothetical protein
MSTLGKIAPDYAGDEVARDDEKNVDANISAAKAAQTDVIEEDRQDGKRAQAIDIGPILGWAGRMGLRRPMAG